MQMTSDQAGVCWDFSHGHEFTEEIVCTAVIASASCNPKLSDKASRNSKISTLAITQQCLKLKLFNMSFKNVSQSLLLQRMKTPVHLRRAINQNQARKKAPPKDKSEEVWQMIQHFFSASRQQSSRNDF